MNYRSAIIKRIEKSNGRGVILFGRSGFTKYIASVLLMMENEIILRGYYSTDFDFVIQGLKKVTKENLKNNIFVLVADDGGHAEAYHFLTTIGLEYLEDFSMMNTVGYVEMIDRADPLLGYARSHPFFGYGELATSRYKVVVLGDSCSDHNRAGIDSWVLKLQQKLGDDYYVGNGAVAGYSSAQCLLKLIRDVIPLAPDIVIYVGGVTDIADASRYRDYYILGKWQKRMWDGIVNIEGVFPDSLDMRGISQIYYGEKNCVEDSDEWIRNTRIMNSICASEHIDFWGVLEPMAGVSGYKFDSELLRFFHFVSSVDVLNEQRRFMEAVEEYVSKTSYMIDVVSDYSGKSEMFYDSIHMNELGNQFLANLIYKKIFSEGKG